MGLWYCFSVLKKVPTIALFCYHKYMKTMILTGGGSGGHLAPIRAVAPELKKKYKLIWIGSSDFEKNSARNLDIEFKKIASGKLRRGLTIKNFLKNFVDAFRVEFGAWQSLFFMIKKRPKKVFSTGGFVSVPVVISAWLLRIPVVIHEQTIGFGLANKIALPVAKKVLLAFEDSKKHIPEKYHGKIEVVGNPIREDLLGGSKENLEKLLGVTFNDKKPILYITGGGQGSQLINEVIFENVEWLTKRFYVIHQAGKSGIVKAKEFQTSIRANASLKKSESESYFPFGFMGNELADIYASADVVIARAGAGTVNELDFFGITSIFIPLRPTQNDEQTKNAEWFLKNNEGIIIDQNKFNTQALKNSLEKVSNGSLRRNQKITHKENRAKELILKNLE
jgi:UDP-N-acetylglucosamine--N-acetylmuramyl-(pentapeptide) pyrophosphoryl-undecaprenol N-acetylglucosamine transferase